MVYALDEKARAFRIQMKKCKKGAIKGMPRKKIPRRFSIKFVKNIRRNDKRKTG